MSKKEEQQETTHFYKLGSALFAFVMWGGWAYFVNRNNVSAVTQGTASFIITLFLVHAVTRLYRLISSKISGVFSFLLPALITVSFTGTCLVIAHQVAGTTHIAKTIAPALLVAFLFCIFTALKLKNHNKEKQHV